MSAFTASVVYDRGNFDKAVRLDDVVARAMPDVSREMRSAAIDSFRDAKDPWGESWLPLAPGTLKNRERRGNTRVSPLVDTAKLFDSGDNSSTRDSATVEYGRGLPDDRAEWNQFGTSKAPARPFVALRENGTPDPSASYLARVMQPLVRALAKVFD